ncbi:MAG TPA: mechanosensitive ion channel domain-containing protein, partial [Candidatus Acidoferrales bacterium]|nr:mechanosensitive ion channel domain-containing protein [Candidatus Acidoferrales bacterium]
VDAMRNIFEQEAKNAQATIAGSLRSEELWDLEVAWKNRAARINKWESTISSSSSQLYKDYTLVDQEEKLWEVSLKSYPARSLPAEVERSIRNFLAEAKKVKSELQKRLDAVLIAENQLYQWETAVSVTLGNISLAKDRFRESLVVAERVPLWEFKEEWERMKLPDGGITALFYRQLSDSIDYGRAHTREFWMVVVYFVGMLVLTSYLRRRVAEWTQEHPHFEEATHFLKRNFSLALLLTLVPVALFLAQNAPHLVISATALMLLFPLLRLLPPLIHPASRPVLYLLAGFHVLDSLRNLFLTIPLLDRLSFVVLDAIAILIIVWLFRPGRVKRIQAENAPPDYLIVAARIVLFLLVVSLAANIVGFFDLARVLSTATLYSLYAAFALFGTAGALSVVFAVLLDTDWARSLSIVRHYDKTMSWWVFRALRFIAFALWLNAVLNFFTVKDAVTKAVMTFFTAPIREGRINFSLWDVIAFGLVFVAALGIARGARLILEEDVFPRTRVARGVPEMVSTVVYYTLLLFGFFIALGLAGVDINRFTLLAGAFGVGVGFGMQNIVNNFISGLILLFERPIHMGDTVDVAGIQGVVKHIGIRSSVISTQDGADAIIPNATLISEKLMNWTLTNDWRRAEVRVGVAYGTDLEKAMRLLYSVATADPDVRQTPPPVVVFQGFGDSAQNLELRFWLRVGAHVDVKSRVSIAVAQAFQEAAIEIPVPQRDIRVRSMDGRSEELPQSRRTEDGKKLTSP